MKKYIKELIILTIQLFMFYIFPLFAGPTDAMGMVLLILLSTFILSTVIGAFSKEKLSCLYPLIIAILFIPSVFIYYNESALVHSVWYFVDSLLGIVLGMGIKKLANKKSTWCNKSKIVFFIFICTIVVLFSYKYRDRRTYEINLPQIEETLRVELEQKADGVAVFGIEEMEDIRNVLLGVKRITETESVQDSPVNVENEIKIDFYFDEEKSLTVFVYKKNFNYYIEQPYNGIYRISADEYNSIEKYIRKSSKDGNSTEPYMPDGLDVADKNETGNTAFIQNFNRSPENVTIEVLKNTITNESAEILITDNNQDHYGWGVNFRLQKKDNEKWEELKPIRELSFIEIAYIVDENNQIKMKIDYGKNYGTLENGVYRIVKPIYDKKYIDLYSKEFEIK